MAKRGRPPGQRSPGNNSTTQTAVVIAALTALQEGTAKTKREAAEQTGTSVSALTPASLARVARNPIFRHFLKADPLDITAEITRPDGSKGRVSLREALSQGATRVTAKMADLQGKVGEWTIAERETFRQCERWLATCRTMGLFREGEGPPLPADLAGAAAEPEASLEWWMQDTSRHEQPPGLLTILPPADPQPAEAEDGETCSRNLSSDSPPKA